MHLRRLPLLLGALALSAPALALAQEEDDAPIAYPDEEDSEDSPRKLPRRSEDPTADFDRMRDDEEAEGEFERLAGEDDPNKGLVGEVIVGAMLMDSSRGRVADPTFGLGLRFTWEFGRILNNEPLRETVWADLRWTMAGLSDGTELIKGSTRTHYFSVAPAYEYVFGESKTYGIFGQLGGGFAFQTTSLTIGEEQTAVKGMKPLLQYGVGFRGRPRVSEKMAVAFRIELMRFRRGYMDDTFVGGSIGTAF
ncbi:hypothetical protein [Hyalangium gracile]|uniref:hypothetical protein n=1 Tax=Hyalangium gracile TaxID=394092 RepID=UPI001CCEDFAE|nr:hypothetical protein [Hyalangium gracile]